MPGAMVSTLSRPHVCFRLPINADSGQARSRCGADLANSTGGVFFGAGVILWSQASYRMQDASAKGRNFFLSTIGFQCLPSCVATGLLRKPRSEALKLEPLRPSHRVACKEEDR